MNAIAGTLTAGAGRRLALDVRSDGYAPFSSLKRALTSIGAAGPDLDEALHVFDRRQHAESTLAYDLEANQQAVTRRITRETIVYSKTFFSLAHLLRTAVSGGGDLELNGVEQADRLSLKVIAHVAGRRDTLSARSGHAESAVCSGPTDLFNTTRAQFLFNIALRLPDAGSAGAVQPGPGAPDYSLANAHSDVTLNNPERFLTSQLDAPASERARLEALLSTNCGQHRRAIAILSRLLREQEIQARPAFLAHLSYLAGLIQAKRLQNPARSEAFYAFGRDRIANLGGEDAEIERGWLANGVALNHAITFRVSGDSDAWRAAFDLLQTTFRRIAMLQGDPAIYLKYNLISNTSFLLEMIGAFEAAADILVQTFDQSEIGLDTPHLSYRIGMLHFKAGRLDAAKMQLEAALDLARTGSCPLVCEYVCRVLSKLVPDRELAEYGASLCAEHGVGDAGAYLCEGGLSHFNPATKLPVFFPEVEHGEYGRRDTNTLLAR
jgi:tetratricopeptide (TPR) repeat protein